MARTRYRDQAVSESNRCAVRFRPAKRSAACDFHPGNDRLPRGRSRHAQAFSNRL